MESKTGSSSLDTVLILLVDDEEHQRELTELSLVGVDPTLVITSTQTPSQALRLLSERPFDCLVSDYQMPGMNGVELCAEVRKTSTVPFIIYTGRGSEEVASQAFAAGVDDYVRKEKDLAHYQVLARRIRQAAERHRTSELYRVSIEANREGISIIQGTEVVYANRAMAEMLGLRSPTELIGGSITRWLVEDDREPVVRRTLSRQGGRREPGVFHYSVRRADGEVRVLHASASIISYKGRPASIVFNHDDTEQMSIEDELRASNEELARYSSSLEKMVNERTLGIKAASERLAAFINSASEGFSIYDSKLRIVDVNEAWLKRLRRGMTKSDVIGKHIRDIYPGVEETPRYEEYLKVMKTGTPYNYEGYLAGDVVKRRYYFASVFKVGDGIGIVSRDATAHMELEREADETRRRLEKQLIRADRMDAVGKLTAMLAHDLRNPLNFIRQASDMALQEPERAERLLQLIGENAERSLRMIEDLRSGTKEISLQRASTNLTQLIAKTAEEIKMPDGVEVEIATGEGVGNIDVDAGLMRRVLDNLVTNAVEAMPEGGRFAIRTSVGNGNVCIDVVDTGVGIPPEAAPRIFDTFYSTKPKGLGLGLSFCRRAVEAHGGTLTFTSKKGAGTTFTVKLPTR